MYETISMFYYGLTPLFLPLPRRLPDSPAVEFDPGAALVLRGAPHVQHQELHHQQGPAETSPCSPQVTTFFPAPV